MARLLKGFTDLLQPINLLPDVLAGGGGYPLSGSGISISTNSSIEISNFLRILCYNGASVTNLTYSFSDRVLTVSGNILSTQTSSGIGVYGIRAQIKIPGKPITFTARHTSITSDGKIDTSVTSISATSHTYYFTNRDVRILSSTESIQPAVRMDNIPSGSFSLTISDWAAYEGAYTNPPFCKSIAQLNNEGLMGFAKNDLSSTGQLFLRNNVLKHNYTGWLRMMAIEANNMHLINCKILSSATNAISNFLDCDIMYSATTGNNHQGKIKVLSYKKYSAGHFTKIRLAYSSIEDQTYIEIYISNTYSADHMYSIFANEYRSWGVVIVPQNRLGADSNISSETEIVSLALTDVVDA